MRGWAGCRGRAKAAPVLDGVRLIKDEMAPLPPAQELAVLLLLLADALEHCVARQHDVKGRRGIVDRRAGGHACAGGRVGVAGVVVVLVAVV